jgi:hypothetical protein
LSLLAAGIDWSPTTAFVETEFHGPADQEFIEEEELGEPKDLGQPERIPAPGLG